MGQATSALPRRELSSRYRIWRFIIFNVVFAFIPIGISLMLRELGSINAPIEVYAPEFLFFSVVISATTLGDIFDELYRGDSPEHLLVYAIALLFDLIVSAVLYGSFQREKLFGPQNPVFQLRTTYAAIILSVVLCATSIATEILLTRLQKPRVQQAVEKGTS